jgi:hypothetical protein
MIVSVTHIRQRINNFEKYVYRLIRLLFPPQQKASSVALLLQTGRLVRFAMVQERKFVLAVASL